jgi:hypothetical protein
MNRAKDNGYDDNGSTNTVVIHTPPISGQYAGDDEYVQVFITAEVNTSLVQFAFQDQLKNTVEAVARVIPSEMGPLYSGYAIVGLRPKDDYSINKHGNAKVLVKGGGVWSNSEENDSFIYGGSAGDFTVEDSIIGVVGECDGCQPGAPNAQVVTGLQHIDYPLLPTPICPQDAVWDEENLTLSPGNWNGDFPPHQPPDRKTNLEPGIYCISASTFDMKAQDELVGSDVLLYFINGNNFDWKDRGKATMNLIGRQSGIYKGMVIYVDHGDNLTDSGCDVKINGTSDSNFTGTIYAPTCEIILLGDSNSQGWDSQIIGYTIYFSGNSNTYINYNADHNHHAPTLPQIELTK